MWTVEGENISMTCLFDWNVKLYGLGRRCLVDEIQQQSSVAPLFQDKEVSKRKKEL